MVGLGPGGKVPVACYYWGAGFSAPKWTCWLAEQRDLDGPFHPHYPTRHAIIASKTRVRVTVFTRAFP